MKSRGDKVLIGGYVPPSYKRALQEEAEKTRTTVNEVLLLVIAEKFGLPLPIKLRNKIIVENKEEDEE